jgi:hypothetical protein
MSVKLVESIWLGTSPAQLSALVHFFHAVYHRVDNRNTFTLSSSYAVSVALNALPYAIVGAVLFVLGLLVLIIRSCCCRNWWYRKSLKPGTRAHFMVLGLTGLLLALAVYGSLAVMFQAAGGIDRSVSGTFKSLVTAANQLDNGATFLAQTSSNFSRAVSSYVAQHPSPIGEECKNALSTLSNKAQTLESNVQNVAQATNNISSQGVHVVQYIFLAIVIILLVQAVVTYLGLVLCQGYVQGCCAVFSRFLSLVFAALVMGLAWVIVGLAVAAALALSDACVSQNQLYTYLEQQVSAFQSGKPAPPPPANNAFVQAGLQCPSVSALGTSYSQAIQALNSTLSDCESTIQSATGLNQSDYSQIANQLLIQVEEFGNCTAVLEMTHRFGSLSCGSQRDSDISSAFIVFVTGLVIAAIYIAIYFLLVFDADLIVWAKIAPGLVEQPVLYQVYPMDTARARTNGVASTGTNLTNASTAMFATAPKASDLDGRTQSDETSYPNNESPMGPMNPSAPPTSW